MPLVFEKEIHFYSATNEATIWADDNKGRFRLVIPRSVLIDPFGFKSNYFDNIKAGAFIREKWSEFEQLSQDVRDTGNPELILN